MSTRALACATALLMTTAPAWALTPDELWADWQEAYGAFGASLTADASGSGDRLTLANLTMTFDVSGAQSEANYGTVTLVGQSDGSVRIEVPSTMQAMSTTTIEGETVEQDFTMTFEGFDVVARDQGTSRIYDMAVARFGYAFDDVSGGEAPQPVPMTMILTDIVSRYNFASVGTGTAMNQSFSAAEMTIEANSAGGPNPFEVAYKATGLTSGATGTLPMAAAQPGTSLSDLGVVFEGTMGHDGSTLAVRATTEAGPVVVDGSSTGGAVKVALTPDGLTETLSTEGSEMTVRVPQLPMPVSMSMDELAMGFTLPVGVSDAPKPFALELALRALEVDDVIWSMFDPTGQLPRDPATVVLDLEGEAVMAVDLLSGDPEAMAAAGVPGEVKALNIGELLVSAIGAELTGTGALTFPTPDPSAPVGDLNLSLTGGFALADRLVALGLIPAEQAAFVKGMAGAVATQTGQDALESTITFTEGGGITANGLPLR